MWYLRIMSCKASTIGILWQKEFLSCVCATSMTMVMKWQPSRMVRKFIIVSQLCTAGREEWESDVVENRCKTVKTYLGKWNLPLTSGSHFCGRGKPPTPSGLVDPAGWGTAQPSKGAANETDIALILLIFSLCAIFSSVLLHQRSQISPPCQ